MNKENNKIYFQFDGKNYSTWKYRINSILDDRDLLQYVEDDFEIITLHSTDKEYRKHAKEERKCKSLLIKHVGDDQLEHIKEKQSAKEIYDTLQGIYERKSISGQILLRRKLINMKYTENENINHYLLEFEKVVSELKAIGAKPEEMDLICQLLVTLPSSFDPLVTALETLNPELLRMDFVKSRLIDEYNKRQCRNMKSHGNSHDQVAMSAIQLTCYNCGKDGHKRYSCPNTTRYRNQRQANIAEDEEAAAVGNKDTGHTPL